MTRAAASIREGIWTNPRIGGRVPEIDGLRGVAILTVVAFHYVLSIGAPNHPWWKPVSQGLSLFWSGVDLFFVLSGFLIAGILVDSAQSKSYFRTFYMRRIHRIFPLYYGWMALFFLGLALHLDSRLHGKIFEGMAPLWLYPVFLQNYAPLWLGAQLPAWIGATWSLAVEEQFYLALPAIVRFSGRRALAWLSLAAIFLAPVYRWAMEWAHPHLIETWTFATPARLDGLAMGVGAALLVRNERCWRWLTGNRGLIHAALALLFTGFLVMTYLPGSWYSRKVDHFTAFSALFVTALLAGVAFPDAQFSGALRWRPLLYFGRISYAIYMFHVGILAVLTAVMPGPQGGVRSVVVAGAAFGVTMALAEISWRVIESRMIRRGHVLYRY